MPFSLLVASGAASPFVCWLISAILLVISLVTYRQWWGPNPQNVPGYHLALFVAAVLFFVLGFLLPVWP